ncbi:thiol reductant ABC exporter subunit CydD [Martelella lutilitoris]|uniref:Thiol reductant ABC exporter subunit CydD n=1 Tax=Martelella lutilitoris TaxID=2583532 RepID=A0A5C4JRU0_9HYPH|nr:thiol reductant ABC exporter subunit CydD [Martelella lutilitoris]TNB48093.1 thiol reductant ABC exporter subunit CydD [Martelella lutilitoris]
MPLHDGKASDRERWLKTWQGKARRKGGLTVFFGLLSAALIIAQCLLIARIIAAVVVNSAVLADVSSSLIWLAAVFVLRFFADVLKRGFAFETALSVKTSMRSALFDRIVAMGPVGLEREHSGEIIATMTAGLDEIEGYFSGYLPQKFLAALIPLVVLAVVFPFDKISFLILLITLPILPIFMFIVGKGAEKLNRRQWRRLSIMGAHFFDVIEGLTTLKQLGASRREAAIIARVSEDYRKTTMAVLRVAFLSSLVLEFFATISVAMVAVYVGFRLYYGDMLFFPGLFALLLAPEFFRPLRDMGTQYHARMSALAAAEELIRIFEYPSPQPGKTVVSGNKPLDIAFENVSFNYPEGGGVFDIGLTLASGECIALVGPSGAGKTTLARLLLGFLQPDKGRLLVNGHALGELSERHWFERIGWVPQRPTLFAGTLRENIALAMPDASYDTIEKAASIARAQAMIEAMPKGYDTTIEQDGTGLSCGQAQRIAVARAVLTTPDLLILDEPTAALDREAAIGLLAGLRRALPQTAFFVVTHDARLAAEADRIVSLDGGRIVDGQPDGQRQPRQKPPCTTAREDE